MVKNSSWSLEGWNDKTWVVSGEFLFTQVTAKTRFRLYQIMWGVLADYRGSAIINTPTKPFIEKIVEVCTQELISEYKQRKEYKEYSAEKLIAIGKENKDRGIWELIIDTGKLSSDQIIEMICSHYSDIVLCSNQRKVTGG